MQTAGSSHEAHHEVVGALVRAQRDRTSESPRASDLVKLAAIVCLGAGVAFGDIAVLLALTAVGATALWWSFHHDDAIIEHGVEDAFDRRTGLPLAGVRPVALETVVGQQRANLAIEVDRSFRGR